MSIGPITFPVDQDLQRDHHPAIAPPEISVEPSVVVVSAAEASANAFAQRHFVLADLAVVAHRLDTAAAACPALVVEQGIGRIRREVSSSVAIIAEASLRDLPIDVRAAGPDIAVNSPDGKTTYVQHPMFISLGAWTTPEPVVCYVDPTAPTAHGRLFVVEDLTISRLAVRPPQESGYLVDVAHLLGLPEDQWRLLDERLSDVQRGYLHRVLAHVAWRAQHAIDAHVATLPGFEALQRPL